MKGLQEVTGGRNNRVPLLWLFLNLYFKRDGASIIEFHRIGMSEKNLLGIMAQNQIPVVSQL